MGNTSSDDFDAECTSQTCITVVVACLASVVLVALIASWIACSLTRYSTKIGHQQPLSDLNRLLCGWRNPDAENAREGGGEHQMLGEGERDSRP